MTEFQVAERPLVPANKAKSLSPLVEAIIATVDSGEAVKVARNGRAGSQYHARFLYSLRKRGLRLRTRTVQDSVYLWAEKRS